MEVAQTVKKKLASIGYRVDLRPFHKLQLWLLLERMLTLVSQFLYLFRVANTSREYTETFFMIMVGILLYISLASTIIEMPIIFTFIDNMEQVITERKCFGLCLI